MNSIHVKCSIMFNTPSRDYTEMMRAHWSANNRLFFSRHLLCPSTVSVRVPFEKR